MEPLDFEDDVTDSEEMTTQNMEPYAQANTENKKIVPIAT